LECGSLDLTAVLSKATPQLSGQLPIPSKLSHVVPCKRNRLYTTLSLISAPAKAQQTNTADQPI